MSTEPYAPIRGRAPLTLQACTAQSQGFWHQAYPTYMPMLAEMGLVEERHVRGVGRSQPAWFLTQAGRAAIAELRPSETRED